MSSLGHLSFAAISGVADDDEIAGNPHLDQIYQFACLFEDSATLVAVFDPDDRLLMSNASFRKAFFIAPDEHPTWEEFMRRNHRTGRGLRLPDGDLEAWISAVASRRGNVAATSFEIGLFDGRWFAMHETSHPSGWLLAVGCDISHLNVSERRLRQDRDDAQRAAEIDELTGVSNRRHIMSMLDLMRDPDSDLPMPGGFACLLDIDNFKAINDTYGHQAGDTVLIAFARCVLRSIRLRDSFGRVGGEEFLALIATNDEAVALDTMDRVFTSIRALRPLAEHPSFRLTFSAGLVRITPNEEVATIYSRCDKLLYQAKQDGRDRLLHSF